MAKSTTKCLNASEHCCLIGQCDRALAPPPKVTSGERVTVAGQRGNTQRVLPGAGDSLDSKKVNKERQIICRRFTCEPIVKGIVYSEGIAVDWIVKNVYWIVKNVYWIVKNVYWIDAKSGTIGVARTDASHRCWIDAVAIGTTVYLFLQLQAGSSFVPFLSI